MPFPWPIAHSTEPYRDSGMEKIIIYLTGNVNMILKKRNRFRISGAFFPSPNVLNTS